MLCVSFVMRMPMMQVGRVSVPVDQRLVHMPMRVQTESDSFVGFVIIVLIIVPMPVLMLNPDMPVFVCMLLQDQDA